MKPADRYYRFVRWSEEDACYIGYCPDLYEGGICHGEQEEAVYAELCEIVRDEVGPLAEGQTLPEPAVRATRDLEFLTCLGQIRLGFQNSRTGPRATREAKLIRYDAPALLRAEEETKHEGFAWPRG